LLARILEGVRGQLQLYWRLEGLVCQIDLPAQEAQQEAV
jgi:hypothetical protein